MFRLTRKAKSLLSRQIQYSNMAKRTTSLIALDFDHTVVDENTDVEVQKLAPGGAIPLELKSTYKSSGWTKFMGNIFRYLHQHGVGPQDILQLMADIRFTDGMKELLHYCAEKKYEVIIISDSNSVFIDHILDVHKLKPIVHSVYTNPAQFNKEGLLEIDFYHVQDWCDLSTENLCKGHILESHVKERQAGDVTFDRIVYIGDGGNDLCPCLRLSENDLACARKGFKLIEKLGCVEGGRKETVPELKAQVLGWETGLDIVQAIQPKTL